MGFHYILNSPPTEDSGPIKYNYKDIETSQQKDVYHALTCNDISDGLQCGLNPNAFAINFACIRVYDTTL